MSQERRWEITGDQVGSRLDHFLTRELTETTRSALQKQIKAEHVLVNNAPATVHRFLKEGDVVTWSDAPTKAEQAIKASYKVAAKPTLIAETDDWLVIDKPIGLLVHPSASSDEATLIDWLLEHYPKMAKVGEDPSRPGIVHRLDRDVSGLLVIAKTQQMFDFLKESFGQRSVEKHYLAFVHGELSKEQDDIKLKIGRSHKEARMAARPIKDEGKAAWTHYAVKERFVGATLVDVEILSGRTHQIRAHFHGIGHPIIGDTLYKRKETDRRIKAPRLMLQSVSLTFADLDGTPRSFALAPDPTFQVLQEEFRRS